MERSFICAIRQEQKFSLISDLIPIKYLYEGTKFLCSLISPSIKEGNCSDEQIFHATVQMGVLRFNVLVLIIPTFQWHMLTHSESTLL